MWLHFTWLALNPLFLQCTIFSWVQFSRNSLREILYLSFLFWLPLLRLLKMDWNYFPSLLSTTMACSIIFRHGSVDWLGTPNISASLTGCIICQCRRIEMVMFYAYDVWHYFIHFFIFKTSSRQLMCKVPHVKSYGTFVNFYGSLPSLACSFSSSTAPYHWAYPSKTLSSINVNPLKLTCMPSAAGVDVRPVSRSVSQRRRIVKNDVVRIKPRGTPFSFRQRAGWTVDWRSFQQEHPNWYQKRKHVVSGLPRHQSLQVGPWDCDLTALWQGLSNRYWQAKRGASTKRSNLQQKGLS